MRLKAEWPCGVMPVSSLLLLLLRKIPLLPQPPGRSSGGEGWGIQNFLLTLLSLSPPSLPLSPLLCFFLGTYDRHFQKGPTPHGMTPWDCLMCTSENPPVTLQAISQLSIPIEIVKLGNTLLELEEKNELHIPKPFACSRTTNSYPPP